jgi:SAM-dependent methyltransferase
MATEWKNFGNRTVELKRGPHPHLRRAVSLCGTGDGVLSAIDLGCGAGRDSLYLAKHGFFVYAVDSSKYMLKLLDRQSSDLKIDTIELVHAKMEQWEYPYADLINASASLFFCRKDDLFGIWGKIIRSLRESGVFSGHFLSRKDRWATRFRDRSSWSQEELEQLMSEMIIHQLCLCERLIKTREGGYKLWKFYSVIAQKEPIGIENG